MVVLVLLDAPRWLASRRETFLLLVAAATMLLSALAVRGLALFALASLPVLTVEIHRLLIRARQFRGARPLVIPSATAIVAALILYYAWLVTTDRFWVHQGDRGRFGLDIDDRAVPRRAADLLVSLRERGLAVRPFNSERTGGYLVFRGLKVFIDSRAAGNILPEYLDILEHPDAFHDAARRHRLNVAVIDLFNRPLLAHLASLPNWRLVHLDEHAAVFIRGAFAPHLPTIDPQADQDRLLADLRAALDDLQPARTPRWFQRARHTGAHLAAAEALWDLGAVRAALALLQDAVILDPPRFDRWRLLGQARELAGDLPGAVYAYDRALARTEPHPDWITLCLAASVELRRGEHHRAEDLARRAAAIAPDRSEPWRIGRAAAHARGDADAERWWRTRGRASTFPPRAPASPAPAAGSAAPHDSP